jgi:uncharacterized protein
VALFFIIFFTLYAAINYYIFIRGWQSLAFVPAIKPFYAVIFIIAASSYILARALHDKIPDGLYDVILAIGSFWFAYILYLFLGIMLMDIIRIINWKFNIYPETVKQNYDTAKFIASAAVFVIASGIILAGYFNTRNIVIKTVEIEIDKDAGEIEELNIAFFADSHLSPLNKGDLLTKIVDSVNSLNPDIVLIAGDVIDDAAAILRKRNIGNEFKGIKSKYGVFASNGNHEFINEVDSAVIYMEGININVIRDKAVLIDNSFYLIGREDTSKINFTKERRLTLEEILEGVDKSKPMIMLEHSPHNLNHAKENGVDLQLSGHTHHGQMAPANLVTNIVYELSWGYLKKENTHYYVTCGVGTWGPPVRVGSDSEIINLKIKFTKKEK